MTHAPAFGICATNRDPQALHDAIVRRARLRARRGLQTFAIVANCEPYLATSVESARVLAALIPGSQIVDYLTGELLDLTA